MSKQQGRTFLGMMTMMAGIIIIAIMGMRIVPVWIDNYQINSSIKSLETLEASLFSDDTVANVQILKDKLMNQLYINGFGDIKADEVAVTPTVPGTYLVTIKYVVVKALAYNMSLLFDFNNAKEVTVGPK